MAGIVFVLLLSLLLIIMHFNVCLPAVMKPFSFHCYQNDICTFPYTFCSSEEHLHRCMPCTKEICQQETPPLQCSYNCTTGLREKIQQKDVNTGVEGNVQTDSREYNSSGWTGWKVASVVQSVLLLVFVLAGVLLLFKWRRQSKKAEKKSGQNPQPNRAEEQPEAVPLVDIPNADVIDNERNDVRAEHNKVPVEAEDIGSNHYRPTTNLAKYDSPDSSRDRQ